MGPLFIFLLFLEEQVFIFLQRYCAGWLAGWNGCGNVLNLQSIEARRALGQGRIERMTDVDPRTVFFFFGMSFCFFPAPLPLFFLTLFFLSLYILPTTPLLLLCALRYRPVCVSGQATRVESPVFDFGAVSSSHW